MGGGGWGKGVGVCLCLVCFGTLIIPLKFLTVGE